MQRHSVFISPLVQRLRRELGAMVDDDPLRQTALLPLSFQYTEHTRPTRDISLAVGRFITLGHA